jgi:hypothetical protein
MSTFVFTCRMPEDYAPGRAGSLYPTTRDDDRGRPQQRKPQAGGD